jgi:hypothetical protein
MLDIFDSEATNRKTSNVDASKLSGNGGHFRSAHVFISLDPLQTMANDGCAAATYSFATVICVAGDLNVRQAPTMCSGAVQFLLLIAGRGEQ